MAKVITEVVVEKEEAFEPKIVGFLCNWCCYGGADMAGLGRMQYPSNIRIIRVMCSGRVDPQFILEAFRRGADGVFVGGCHIGDCHYVEGNYRTERRIKLLHEFMKQINMNPKRLRLDWVSASEGEKFTRVIKDFVATLKKLGPGPFNVSSKK